MAKKKTATLSISTTGGGGGGSGFFFFLGVVALIGAVVYFSSSRVSGGGGGGGKVASSSSSPAPMMGSRGGDATIPAGSSAPADEIPLSLGGPEGGADGGADTESLVAEHSAADMIRAEGKRVAGLVESSVGGMDPSGIRRQRMMHGDGAGEMSLADDLEEEAKRVKNVVEKAEAAGVSTLINAAHTTGEAGNHDARVDGFGIFMEPHVAGVTRVRIRSNGQGVVAPSSLRYAADPVNARSYIQPMGTSAAAVSYKRLALPCPYTSAPYRGASGFDARVEAARLARESRGGWGLANEVFGKGEWPYKCPGGPGRVEAARATDLGVTDHKWADGSGLTSGVEPNAWDRPDKNWDEAKEKIEMRVRKIAKLFDKMFKKELFPDAVLVQTSNGVYQARNGSQGSCLSLERFYQYVEGCITTTLGLGKVEPLSWGPDIDLTFESIDKARIQLREALQVPCDKAGPGYTLAPDKTVKVNGAQAVALNIPWPKDKTVLVNHLMKIG